MVMKLAITQTETMRTKFNDLSQYPLWYARYEVTKEKMLSEYKPLIWQYSSKGKVDGIKGNVDMNEYYGTFDDGKKEETEENIEENKKDNSLVKIDENAVIPYSKAKQGDEKLSANFKIKEFACNDGSDVVYDAQVVVSHHVQCDAVFAASLAGPACRHDAIAKPFA